MYRWSTRKKPGDHRTSSLVTCACLVDDSDAGSEKNIRHRTSISSMDFSLINPQNSTSDDFSLINPQIYSKHIFNPEIPTTSILPSYSVVSASASSVRSNGWEAFRCLSASWCCSLWLKQCLRLVRSHVPKAIPGQLRPDPTGNQEKTPLQICSAEIPAARLQSHFFEVWVS